MYWYLKGYFLILALSYSCSFKNEAINFLKFKIMHHFHLKEIKVDFHFFFSEFFELKCHLVDTNIVFLSHASMDINTKKGLV